MNTTWTVRIERLQTRLRVGIGADEHAPQPMTVTLRLRGVAPACPGGLSECIDYAPLCRWITEEWPHTPHVALLETRVNELLAFAFDLDARVQEVHAGLAKQRMGATARQREGVPSNDQAVSVGIERCVSRHEFEAQRRHLATTKRTCDERLPA